MGEKGADPQVTILIPEGRVPWQGHSGRYAIDQVYEQIKAHRLTLIFCNTRGLAELIFQDLRSEEHTSELQSLMRISYAVFCLKKIIKKTDRTITHLN